MRTRLWVSAGTLAVLLGIATLARAHCQLPCGIYDDPARFTQLQEHVTTIEKSMNQIIALSQEKTPNWNQLVRWVNNKDVHADALTEIVTYYFLAQRVKPADPAEAAAQAKYLREISLLHKMIVHAMKAKQTTDLEHCKQLRALIKAFQASYLGKPIASQHSGHTHLSQHEHSQPSQVGHSHSPQSDPSPSQPGSHTPAR